MFFPQKQEGSSLRGIFSWGAANGEELPRPWAPRPGGDGYRFPCFQELVEGLVYWNPDSRDVPFPSGERPGALEILFSTLGRMQGRPKGAPEPLFSWNPHGPLPNHKLHAQPVPSQCPPRHQGEELAREAFPDPGRRAGAGIWLPVPRNSPLPVIIPYVRPPTFLLFHRSPIIRHSSPITYPLIRPPVLPCVNSSTQQSIHPTIYLSIHLSDYSAICPPSSIHLTIPPSLSLSVLSPIRPLGGTAHFEPPSPIC